MGMDIFWNYTIKYQLLKVLLDYKSTHNIAKHSLMTDFPANGESGISRGQTLQVVTKDGWCKGVSPLKAVSLDIE